MGQSKLKITLLWIIGHQLHFELQWKRKRLIWGHLCQHQHHSHCFLYLIVNAPRKFQYYALCLQCVKPADCQHSFQLRLHRKDCRLEWQFHRCKCIGLRGPANLRDKLLEWSDCAVRSEGKLAGDKHIDQFQCISYYNLLCFGHCRSQLHYVF